MRKKECVEEGDCVCVFPCGAERYPNQKNTNKTEELKN